MAKTVCIPDAREVLERISDKLFDVCVRHIAKALKKYKGKRLEIDLSELLREHDMAVIEFVLSSIQQYLGDQGWEFSMDGEVDAETVKIEVWMR